MDNNSIVGYGAPALAVLILAGLLIPWGSLSKMFKEGGAPDTSKLTNGIGKALLVIGCVLVGGKIALSAIGNVLAGPNPIVGLGFLALIAYLFLPKKKKTEEGQGGHGGGHGGGGHH